MVLLLIGYGADPNLPIPVNNITPLYIAAEKGSWTIVELLIKNGAAESIHQAKEDDQFTPLICASMFGHTKVVEILLKNGASVKNVSSDGNAPLMWAARYGHAEVVKLLLSHQANVSSKDVNGNTALHAACYSIVGRNEVFGSPQNYVDVVKMLLQSRANRSEENDKGETPIEFLTADLMKLSDRFNQCNKSPQAMEIIKSMLIGNDHPMDEC